MIKAVFIFICIIACQASYGQESVFGLLKDNQRIGDQFYEEGDYENALKAYKLIKAKKGTNKELEYRLSRSHYFVKDYKHALIHYDKYKSHAPLPAEDVFFYGEINAFLGNYSEAVTAYSELLSANPDDEVLLKKIWRLKNVHFLYEDSLHYTIRPLNINTEYSELCPTPYGEGMVFISDRKKFDIKDSQTEPVNAFLTLYYAESRPDTINSVSLSRFKKPQAFSKELLSGYHFGPISFYNNESQCVFASTGKEPATDGSKKIQLYFASKRDGKWKVTESFQYNDKEFVLTNPSVAPDGGTLYFSSDMPGGFGGSDLYRSEKVDGQWTKPQNLGERINTRLDELFPFISYQTLYFASDGHAGMGGLDIFSIEMGGKGGDVTNIGHPLNSSADDFGIAFNSKSHGYLSSNRKNGGYDDDLFEFETDFRTYPFDISGVVKIKESNLVDTAGISVLSNAKIYLIDNIRQRSVSESKTDASGNFTLSIPWFSKYLLRVVTKDNQEHLASLEISKASKEASEYEIVVVKDLIQSLKNTDQK
jgi:tetratricopeptide (TPR) repeat protein